ncbi:MAG: triphosphatase [Methylophagaceae bacterium]|jgi:triphosphatase
MALEQELKLSVLEGEIDLKTIVFDGYQQSEVTSQRLISTYFDTSELALIKNGFGLRLRFDGKQWFQTLKETGQVKRGLHQRQEWEQGLLKEAFDEDLLKATPLRTLIENEAVWPKVSSVFTTDFIRQIIILRDQSGAQIEVAYDKGRVYTDVEATPIHEIELELKAGNVNQLQAIAAHLISILPLQTSDSSKAGKGYGLLRPQQFLV